MAFARDSSAIQDSLPSSDASTVATLLVEETSLLGSVWNLSGMQKIWLCGKLTSSWNISLPRAFPRYYGHDRGSTTGHHKVRALHTVCQPALCSAPEITAGTRTVD
ncbi:unnamed protein product [Mortierella alpina]